MRLECVHETESEGLTRGYQPSQVKVNGFFCIFCISMHKIEKGAQVESSSRHPPTLTHKQSE